MPREAASRNREGHWDSLVNYSNFHKVNTDVSLIQKSHIVTYHKDWPVAFNISPTKKTKHKWIIWNIDIKPVGVKRP